MALMMPSPSRQLYTGQQQGNNVFQQPRSLWNKPPDYPVNRTPQSAQPGQQPSTGGMRTPSPPSPQSFQQSFSNDSRFSGFQGAPQAQMQQPLQHSGSRPDVQMDGRDVPQNQVPVPDSRLPVQPGDYVLPPYESPVPPGGIVSPGFPSNPPAHVQQFGELYAQRLGLPGPPANAQEYGYWVNYIESVMKDMGITWDKQGRLRPSNPGPVTWDPFSGGQPGYPGLSGITF